MNRLTLEKRVLVAKCIQHNTSLRAAADIAGCDINTVCSFMLALGKACAEHHDRVMRELKFTSLQLDEMWTYIGAKEDRLKPEQKGSKDWGDCYVWIAIDPTSKLVPSWHAGKRTAADAQTFMNDLASRVEGRVQLSSDGFKAYQPAIEEAFGAEACYGQLHKILDDCLKGISAADWLNKKRYCQPTLEATNRIPILGQPDITAICTSHIERFNLTVRMSLRRCARATNAYSKRFDSFHAAMAFTNHVYNFARYHESIRCSPAMEAGLSKHIWKMEEIVGLVPTPAANRPKTYRKRAEAA